jgi:purine-binding chemotaxis protein CheW
MVEYNDNQSALRVLVCELGRERYGFVFDVVIEVLQAVALTPLPGAPPVVEGVINVRGTLVPVIALGARLGFPAEPLKVTDHLVLATAGAQLVAIRVERVTELLSVQPEEIVAPQDLRGASPCIGGAAPLRNGLLLVCDLEAFLEEAERRSLTRALETAPPKQAQP